MSGLTKAEWAGLDENGTTGWNGKAKAGDQTGKEVRNDNWYYFGQSQIFRATDPALAAAIARIAETLADNPAVGYDQSERWTLNDWLKANKYAYTKLTTPVECDCSALALSCINTALKRQAVNGGMTTATMEAELAKTGLFEMLTDDIYTKTDCYLKAGDLVNAPSNHVIIMTEDGRQNDSKFDIHITGRHTPGDTLTAANFDVKYNGKYVTGYAASPLKLSATKNYILVEWNGTKTTVCYNCETGETVPILNENPAGTVNTEPPAVEYPESVRPWCLVTPGQNIAVRVAPTETAAKMEKYPELAATNGVTLCGQNLPGTWCYVFVAKKWYGWVQASRLIDNKTKEAPEIVQKITAPAKACRYVAKVEETAVVPVVTGPGSRERVRAHEYLGHNNLVDVIGTDAGGTWAYINIVGVKGWCKLSALRKV